MHNFRTRATESKLAAHGSAADIKRERRKTAMQRGDVGVDTTGDGLIDTVALDTTFRYFRSLLCLSCRSGEPTWGDTDPERRRSDRHGAFLKGITLSGDSPALVAQLTFA